MKPNLDPIGSISFQDLIQGLMAGDFTRMSPAVESDSSGAASPVLRWHTAGLFADHPEALLEAFTCACFNGQMGTVDGLIAAGVDPSGGIRTGLNAVHWAANRGHLDVVRRLLRAGVPLETLNSYGGTVLGCAVWSAVNEPRPGHVPIVGMLLEAGAKVACAGYPSRVPAIDQLLRLHGHPASGGSGGR